MDGSFGREVSIMMLLPSTEDDDLKVDLEQPLENEVRESGSGEMPQDIGLYLFAERPSLMLGFRSSWF